MKLNSLIPTQLDNMTPPPKKKKAFKKNLKPRLKKLSFKK